jgi:uncharacterized protein (DUF488 family)
MSEASRGSRWVQFNGEVLQANLLEKGISYEWLPECGGKTTPIPTDLAYGVERILELAADVKTAIMCSESQPLTKHKTPRANCHRVGLLAPMLKAKGAARIVHICRTATRLSLTKAPPSRFGEEKGFSNWLFYLVSKTKTCFLKRLLL